MTTLRYLDTAPHSCSYIPRQKAITKFVLPTALLDNDVYSELAKNGYRRSGDNIYTPACSNCRQCIPVRLKVTDFKLTRRHLRTKKRNADITIHQKPSSFENEHFELYKSYINVRHADSPMSSLTRKEYMSFLTSSWSNTAFLEFRANNKLLAVAVTDLLKDGMSSVYTFFCPEASHRSLGNFAILKQIELAKELELQWLYLGYWMRDCRKLSYKTNFRPIQYRINEQWTERY